MVNPHLKQVVYMPSTPLNILLSIVHARQFQSQQQATLWFIDQKMSAEESPYFRAIQQWSQSPFHTVEFSRGDATGKDKLKQRRQVFQKIQEYHARIPVDIVVTGSDRRVEFQFLMQLIKRHNATAQGWYLDDGLYSYAGRPSFWLKDGVDRWLKKLVYGVWWEEPITVGASAWIDQAWLFVPLAAVTQLRHKALHRFEVEWFRDPAIQAFSLQVLSEFGADKKYLERLQRIEVLVLTPHPSDIVQMPGYILRLETLLQQLQVRGAVVGVKPHPKSASTDVFGWGSRFDVWMIPPTLAFEFVLPLLSASVQVVGDIGTSVLTAKWLRPDIDAGAVLNPESSYEQGFEAILKTLDVAVYADYQWVGVERNV